MVVKLFAGVEEQEARRRVSREMVVASLRVFFIV
jgi:hypothetical protein